jgi:hypothetical protein
LSIIQEAKSEVAEDGTVVTNKDATGISLFVSLVYWAESTVRWFVVREKHCWMTADSADKSKRTGRDLRPRLHFQIHPQILLCKKKIPHHIKIPAHVWNTKCR